MPIGPHRLASLQARRALCQAIINTLTGIDDPRRDDAIAEYRRQLAVIDQDITDLTGKPPDVVVGLRSAALFARSERS